MTNKQLYIVLGAVGVAGVAAYFFGAKLLAMFKDVNKGTPYEGTGAVGTLGNLTNQILGGVPQSLGESISQWFEPDYSGGDNVFYTVLFPDNSKHAVGATTIDSKGYFTLPKIYGSMRFRLGVNQASQKVAVAA